MMRILLAATFAACLMAPSARAMGYLSGDQLFEYCTLQSGTGPALCLGFILGVAEVMETQRDDRGKAQCVRPNVVNRQLTAVVVKYLQDNPAKRDYSASSIITIALQQAFCPYDPG